MRRADGTGSDLSTAPDARPLGVEVQACKAHKPVFREVASAFASHDDVLIAQFDASDAEDVRKKYSIEGYPAVIFFGKAQK